MRYPIHYRNTSTQCNNAKTVNKSQVMLEGNRKYQVHKQAQSHESLSTTTKP